MNLLLIFLFILVVRVASVFVVQTYYVPDEYWQSLEVAHKLAFGYGYLTWEWVQGVRSYIYPLYIFGVYKVLALLGMDKVELLVLVPRIMQAILTAYSDYRFFIWSGKKKWSLFLVVISWFPFYMGSRTLINTFESSLTAIGLSYFPWRGEGTGYLWVVALVCFIRPTAAIIWIPLCLYHLRKTRLSIMEVIFKRFFLIGIFVGAACIAIDSYFYGRFIITPFEFLKYNLYYNIGSFYGVHPWHWYFTIGLPTVLGINSIPFLFGIMHTIRNREVISIRKHLLLVIFLSLASLSVIEHKEFRFIASLVPFCLYICADTLSRWSGKASRPELWLTAAVLIAGNAFPAWYLGTVHQKGPIELMSRLQEVSRTYRDERNHTASVLFLMPCHSTPFYSHIHENITMRFLTCEPNFKQSESYVDEADQFYDSPSHWLRSHIPSYPYTAMPSHVVLFEPLSSKITDFLKHYRVRYRIENAEHVQEKTGKNILVYQRVRKEENIYNQKQDTHSGQEKSIADEQHDEVHG